jgi:hypothetical protein
VIFFKLKETTMRQLRIKPILSVIVGVLLSAPIGTAATDIEPGAEDGGLRLRLAVVPRSRPGKEGFDVRIDIINSSRRTISLRTGWTNEDPGDVKDYLEAATSIECVPAIAPWIGGVQQGRRQSPQRQQGLEAGEALSVAWQSYYGWQLKNRVTNPNEVQNPVFPVPGLYSVHAILDVITDEGVVRLRSNEQLVAVEGSRAAPKHTLGQLLSADRDKKTAVLGLGSLHKVDVGDQFEIGNAKGMHWRLNITDVKPTYAFGTLEMLTRSDYPSFREPPFPYMPATLRVGSKSK